MLISFLQLKRESKYAVQCLDDSKTNSFPALFMTPVLPLHSYDYIFQYVPYSSFVKYNSFKSFIEFFIDRFSKLSVFRKTVKNFADVAAKLDFRNDYFSNFVKMIIDLLGKTLNQRASSIDYIVEPPALIWPVNEKMPKHENLTIGVKVDPTHAYNIIEKGPLVHSLEVILNFILRCR